MFETFLLYLYIHYRFLSLVYHSPISMFYVELDTTLNFYQQSHVLKTVVWQDDTTSCV
jgi:hypothetical protein